jgi:hypothetical protein
VTDDQDGNLSPVKVGLKILGKGVPYGLSGHSHIYDILSRLILILTPPVK